MRKIISGIVLVLVFVITGLVVILKTIDLNQYLPQIKQQISRAVGRDFSVEKIKLDFSIKKGVFVDLAQIALSDDPQFSKAPFVLIKHVHVGVGFISLITKRQLEIISIEIQTPEIVIIRNAKGVFNYESMVPQKKFVSSNNPTDSDDQSANFMGAFPKLLVNSFTIADARIVYQDLAPSSKIHLSVEDIDASVSGFSLQEPFKILLDAAVFASTQNIHLDAVGRIDVQLQQARFDDVHFQFDLSKLEVSRMNQEVPPLKALGIGDELNGTIQALINQMVVGVKGLLVLSLDGKIEDGRVPVKMLAVPIDGLSAKLDMSESKIKLSNFVFNLSSGQFTGQLSVKDYMTVQDYDLEVSINQLPLEDVLVQEQSPVKIRGIASGSAHLKGRGFKEEDMQQILGQAKVELSNAQLLNMNIVKSVLDRIPLLSSLGPMTGSSISPGVSQSVASDTTEISSAHARVRIENANILLDDFQLKADQFNLSAHGSVGFDQEVDAQANVILSPELSQSLIERASDMKLLLDQEKKIQFPVKISGKIPQLNYVPDAGYISKVLLVNKGGGEIQKVLEKNPKAKKFLDILTGGKKKTVEKLENKEGNSSADDSLDGPAAEPSEGEQLLKNILQQVF